jgi:biuret amidohydrolase
MDTTPVNNEINQFERGINMNEHERVLELIRLKDQVPSKLDPSKTALLVIDVQRYFVSPDYPFGQTFEKLVPGATAGYFERVRNTVIPNIKRLQEFFRSQHLPIIYTAIGSHMEDGRDLPGQLRDLDQLGLAVLGKRITPPVNDPGWQIDDSVAPLPGELVLNKTSCGPLNSTKLDQTLHNMGIDTLIVAGLTTDVCVTQTARETADRGFQVTIAEDACTTLSEELHRHALQSFNIVFGRVKNADEVLSSLSAAGVSGVGV